MQSFPSNTHELAREIAAFATSNTGTIIIGVSDSGDIVGLESGATASERDSLIKRLEGISRGTVKPAIRPTVRFAVESDAVVLVVTVPKGAQPMYYSRNTPYVRHLTGFIPISRTHSKGTILMVGRMGLSLDGYDDGRPR